MAMLEQVITNLQTIGVFKIALPFLLTFAIIYGLLEKLHIFSEDGSETEQKVNAIIAITAAFFVTLFAANSNVALLLTNFFGAFAVVLVFLLGAMMSVELVGGGSEKVRKHIHNAFLLIAGLAVIAIFLSWGGLAVLFPEGFLSGLGRPGVFLSATNLITLVVILAAIGLMLFVVRGGD